jgi:hypothetical protein
VVRVAAKMPLAATEDWEALFADLQFLRKPHSVRAASHVIRQAFTLATGNREVQPQRVSYNTFFGMQISLPLDKSNIPDFTSHDYAKEIVGLLIGDSEVGALSDRIVERIAKRNERLNEKSSYEYILTNRGGLIYVIPSLGYASPHPDRFNRALELSELALLAASFLDFASGERRTSERLVYFLLSRIRNWIEAPNVVFPTSTTNQLHWEVLADSLSLHDRLVQWEKTNGPEPDELRELWRQVPVGWWEIAGFADALDRLAGQNSQLSFIKDNDMRLFVESDLMEARRCLSTGNNKAALVMAGASVEAILLALLEDNQPAARRSALRKMHLSTLIEEACPDWRNSTSPSSNKRIISTNMAALLDTSCRPWRNVIHPGRVIRDNIEVTPTMAGAAIAALNLLIEESGSKSP